MYKSKSSITIFIVFLAIIVSVGFVNVSASEPVGERIGTQNLQSLNNQSLSRVVNEFGKISLSLDAMGTLDASGTIQVEKPNGAVVRKAYLLSATTGFANARLSTGDITLQGNAVVWGQEIPSSIYSYNYWADVTAMVKSTIDSAPAGLVDLTLTEASTLNVDGEILAVIFDDPNQTTDNTVMLYFGAQDVNGDSFVIDFGSPIDKSDPNLVIDYSLGISYGYQTSIVNNQYSQVDVNGTRLTTSAGGQDDGAGANGALITVGGIGDSNANPPDPNTLPINERTDDELYDLVPLVNDGATSIRIDTLNPSDDDNILFAAVFVGTQRGISAIDLDISLYNNPTSATDRAAYESIINYFADGVYESSNGAHKIGRVTFHPNGANADQSDVVWIQKCHPNANLAGIAVAGWHVNFCDVFEKGGFLGDLDFLKDNNNQRKGGYALAHEWGHYYYTLYDEYKGNDKNDNNTIHLPHTTDKAVKDSIMNQPFKAHNLLGDDFKWLNFSIAKNDTGKTAQHRVYGASGWETLARSQSNDPRDGKRLALPERIYYPELATVAPGAGQAAQIDLPGSARSALNINWQTATTDQPALSNPANIPFTAQLSSLLGDNITYPSPIVLLAFVQKDVYVTDMEVVGSVQFPDGTSKVVTFTDDGFPPDAEQGDGLYSAILGYETAGIYTIQAQFSNAAGTAKFVSSAFAPAQGEAGPVPMPGPVPISEDFAVSKTIQVSVSNVAVDDYGNTPGDAKSLIADNVSVPGKIDYPTDLDVFQVTTLECCETTVRVSNLALGMNPRVRVIDSDMSTVLFDTTLEAMLGDYLFITLSGVPTSSTVYVEVSDVSGDAEGGLYDLSIGESVASDFPSSRVSLPFVMK